MYPAIEQFLALVNPWIRACEFVAASTMGVTDGTEACLVSGRLVFGPNISPMPQIVPLDGPELWARTEVVPVDGAAVRQILSAIENGAISLGRTNAALPAAQGERIDISYLPGYHPAFTKDQSAARIATLSVAGGSRTRALERVVRTAQLDWQLRTFDPPFSDMGDLHTFYGLPSPSQAGDRALIEVVVRPPVDLDQRSMLSAGTMHVRILAAKKVDTSQICVGYRIVGGTTRPLRGVIPAGKFSWTDGASALEGVATLDVGDAPTAQCFVTYAGSCTQAWWLIDPTRHLNPRRAVHAAFDPDLTILKRLLFEAKKSDARTFEDGVAMLLGMLNFSVTQHGRSQKLSDAPDIVAVTAKGQIAVVECTMGLPDQDDQVAKAIQRAEALRRSVGGAGWAGLRVLPVVVTAVRTSDVQAQKSDAEGKGVLVMCLEDLEEAVNRTIAPVDSDQVFEEAEQRLATPRLFGGAATTLP